MDKGFERRALTENGTPSPPSPKPKLLDQVRQAIRTRHYSGKTEKAYVHWIRRFIFFHSKRYPAEMAEPEIGRFLSTLATDGHVSASTQNQAFNAILFLYHEILNKKIGLIDGVVRAKRPQRLPVVLTQEEIKRIIYRMNGTPRLMALLMYGAGLRLMECCRLRVKDIDFSGNEILVRSGKGNKDRHTMLPSTVRDSLIQHLGSVRTQHDGDLKRGLGRVCLPNALNRKYPNAGKEWGCGCFQQRATMLIGRREKSAGIICMNRFCNVPSKKRVSKLLFSSRPGVTRCAILLPHICWRTATI